MAKEPDEVRVRYVIRTQAIKSKLVDSLLRDLIDEFGISLVADNFVWSVHLVSNAY